MTPVQSLSILEPDQSATADIKEKDAYLGEKLNKQYLVGKWLGSGAFGKVYLVTDLLDSIKYFVTSILYARFRYKKEFKM